MVAFTFVRNGQTHSDVSPGLKSTGLCLGLTEKGVNDARRSAARMQNAGISPARVLHCPQIAVHQTALVIARTLRVDDSRIQSRHELLAALGGMSERQCLAVESLLQTIRVFSEEGDIAVVACDKVWKWLHDHFHSSSCKRVLPGHAYATQICDDSWEFKARQL